MLGHFIVLVIIFNMIEMTQLSRDPYGEDYQPARKCTKNEICSSVRDVSLFNYRTAS